MLAIRLVALLYQGECVIHCSEVALMKYLGSIGGNEEEADEEEVITLQDIIHIHQPPKVL